MKYQMVQLASVCTINPRLPKDLNGSQKISFLHMASVSERGEILRQETRVLSETKKGFTYFERGDVLLAKITPCFENGKAVLTDKLEHLIGFGSTEFHVIRPLSRVDGKYIFYLIWNDRFRHFGEHAMKGAAGQKRISADFLKNFQIPLPSLAEQKQIAAILDAADSLRQKDQQLVEHYTALSQSLFMDMFGDLSMYKTLPIRDVSNFIDYRGKTPNKTTSGIPLLTAKNVKNGYISTEPYEYISDKDYLSWMTRGFPNEGDLLFTTEAPLGQVALMPKYSKVALAQRIICIQPFPELNSVFLMHVLMSIFFKKQLFNLTTGSTVKGVRSKELAKIEIPLPAIDIQNQFAERVEVIEKQKQQAQMNLEKSEMLFNSLLQRAFTGELTANKAA